MNRSGSQNTLKSMSNFGNENNSLLLEASMRSHFLTNTVSRDKSPNRAKIAQLAEKLSSTHLASKDEELALEKEAQGKLQLISQEIDNLYKSTEKEFSGLKEEAIRAEEMLELEHKEKVALAEKKQREFKQIENSLDIEMSNERLHSPHSSPHDSIMQPNAFGEKFYSLKLDLAKEKKVREETAMGFFEEVEERINEIVSENLNKTRLEAHEKLVKRLGQEITGFHQMLAEERKKRKDMHDSLMGMVKDIYKRVMQEVAAERAEREETQESLIKLLEDT